MPRTRVFLDVEGELCLVVANMAQGGDLTGGPYTSLWSAVGTSLEENRVLNRIIATLAQQAKQVIINVQQAHQGSSQDSHDVFDVHSILCH
jgi:hypothetical protein